MLVLSWFACSEHSLEDEHPPSHPTYHADVKPILEGRCTSCHAQGGIGSFPLTTYAEASAVAEVVGAVTASRQMPPWKAAPGHLDYNNDPSLTDAQIATIAAWVEAGAPEGDPASAGEPLPTVGVALPRTDVTISVPEPYLPQDGPDDYRCFVMDWTEPGTSYVTGFEVHPGNASVVHHVMAFLVRPDGPVGPWLLNTVLDWDASEEGPGYTCSGGPNKDGDRLNIPILLAVQQIAQWVPGGGAGLFPEGVGIPVPEGSRIILRTHYNTLSSDGNPDQSRLDFMVEPEVERVGALVPWLDSGWMQGDMDIPPNTTTSYVAQDDPLKLFDNMIIEDIDLTQGFDIHAVMPHMHNVGSASTVRLDRQDGSSQVLVEVPDWDFNWQLTYSFREPIPFVNGDELFLECIFDNTTDELIEWGEGSAAEMCVANLLISVPR